MNSSPIVHIGPIKTGSTWLQTGVFPTADGWRIAGMHQRPRTPADRELNMAVWRAGKQSFDDRSAHIIRSAVAECEGRLLITNELLAGHPWSRGAASDAAQRGAIAERLHALIPNARILMVRREVDDWIRSAYDEFLRDGGRLSRHQFSVDPEVLAYANFGELEELYRARFQDVMAVSFFDLQANPSLFVRNLSAQLNVCLYVRPLEARRRRGIRSAWRQEVVRALNNFRPSMLAPEARLVQIPGAGRLVARLSRPR
jgi:hypothetical protein